MCEGVFDVFGSRVEIAGTRFLDLYAGTGAVGIEALSRGAARAIFVERDVPTIEILRSNLELVGVGSDEAEVIDGPVASARIPSGGVDLAFADPPFRAGLLGEALSAMRAALAPGGWVILQAAREEEPPSDGAPEFSPDRSYRHGATTLWLYRKG